jgi:hypothetical protein
MGGCQHCAGAIRIAVAFIGGSHPHCSPPVRRPRRPATDVSLINFYWVCGSSNITVENCTLGWCGGNAIGSDDGYVTNFNIINNEIGFCGNYGLDAVSGPVRGIVIF